MVRAFVAIDLPDAIRDRIRVAQKALLQSDAKVTPVDPKIVHITLNFLGEVEPPRIRRVSEVLGGVTGTPFTLTVRGIQGNPSGRPRVIWCEIEDGGGCAGLHQRIEELLAPLGFPRESRRYVPHATVARVRRFDPSLLAAISPLSSMEFGSCRVDGISLKKSTLTPKGPIYEDIMEVVF